MSKRNPKFRIQRKYGDSQLRITAARALEKIDNLDILRKLISSPEIDIYDPIIFRLARAMAIRYCKEEKNKEIDFIPVTPKVIKKYRSAATAQK
jgi:hypothetical protein